MTAPKLTEAQRLKIEHDRTLKQLNARVDKTFAHVDGSPHAVTGPAGCVACARRRHDALQGMGGK